MVKSASVQVPALPVFRVTTYEVSFTSTSVAIDLEQALAEHHFVLVRPRCNANTDLPDDLAARASATTGGDTTLTISRNASTGSWVGTITVVECLRDHDTDGFRLVEVVETSLSASGAAGLDEQTDTLTGSWSQIDQVVCFGGLNGGGVDGGSLTITDDWPSCFMRVFPSGSQTLNFHRWEGGTAGTEVEIADVTTYVVEWGRNWTVDRVETSGGNDGDETVAGNWNTASIGRTVDRAKTWLWSTGWADNGDDFQASPPSALVALGDGVNESSTETEVAVNVRGTITDHAFDVYVLSHPNLAVDHESKPFGEGTPEGTGVDLHLQPVDGPTDDESYTSSSGTGWSADVTSGRRLAWVTNNISSGANVFENVFTVARHRGPGTLGVGRNDNSNDSTAARIQSIDFGAVTHQPEAPTQRAIRVTTYEIDEQGASGTLKLDQPLARNYFALCFGGERGGTAEQAEFRVSGDPWGSGDLAESGAADELDLETSSTDAADARGAVVVVESLGAHDSSGFRLRYAAAHTLESISAAGAQVLRFSAGGSRWRDPDQVVPFGGIHGGGVHPEEGVLPGHLCTVRVEGEDEVVYERMVGDGADMLEVTVTTYVVEWGSEWTVQRARVSGEAFGDGSSASHWNTAAISEVARSRTWVWGSCVTAAAIHEAGATAVAYALGDGVAENSRESSVAVLSATDPDGLDGTMAAPLLAEVYAMTHPSLSVGWGWLELGSSAEVSRDVSVSAPLHDEERVGGDTVQVTAGHRAPIFFGANGGQAEAWGSDDGQTDASSMTWARHTADGTLTVDRGLSSWISADRALDHASWTLQNSTTVESDAYQDPVGGMTADAFVVDSGQGTNGNLLIATYASLGTTDSETYRVSFWARTVDQDGGAGGDTLGATLHDGPTQQEVITTEWAYYEIEVTAGTGTDHLDLDTDHQSGSSEKIAVWDLRVEELATWGGWAQSVDFGSVLSRPSRAEPRSALILRDKRWSGSGNVSSLSSEGGRYVGQAVADTGNRGQAVPFQQGIPSSSDEHTYRIARGGKVASYLGGRWGWYLSTETSADQKTLGDLRALHHQFADAPFDHTEDLDGPSVAWSSRYGRVVYAWVNSTTSIGWAYRDADERPWAASWTNGTTSALSNLKADTGADESATTILELPDGTLALFALTENDDAAVDQDVSVAHSTDGGVTWEGIAAGVVRTISNDALDATVWGLRAAISGDWVRLVALSEDDAETLVSADRGISWEPQLADVTIYPFLGGSGPYKQSPCEVVSVDDVSGTFLLVRASSTGEDLEVYVGERDQDWQRDTDLDQDLSGFGTSVDVLAIAAVRTPERIFVFTWVEGSSSQHYVLLTEIDLDDPLSASSWSTETLIDLHGAADFSPADLTAVWCGHHVTLFGAVQNQDVHGGQPLVLGLLHLTSGWWDERPLAPSDKDRWLLDSSALFYTMGWWPYMGAPDDDVGTLWSKTTSGSISEGVDAEALTLTTSDSSALLRYNLSPAGSYGDAVLCGGMVRCRDVRDDDVGVYLSSEEAGGDSFTVSMRFTSTTTLILRDEDGGPSTLDTITIPDAEILEFRLLVERGASQYQVSLLWRRADADQHADSWSSSGPHNLTNGSPISTSHQIRFGVLDNPSTAGTSTVDWYGLWTSGRRFGQSPNDSVGSDVYGAARVNPRRYLVKDGVHVAWGGASTAEGDTYEGKVNHQRGRETLSIDTPRSFWESDDDGAENLVLVADPDNSGARFRVDAAVLVGTVSRTATLELHDSDSWSDPSFEVDLSAELWPDLAVAEVDGRALRLESATGQMPPEGLAGGRYLWVGSAVDEAHEVEEGPDAEGWVHVTDDFATTPSVGDAASIYGDRMVWTWDAAQRYRYARISFPAEDTPTDTHRIGALLPGRRVDLEVPIRWGTGDDEQPRIAGGESSSGISWQKREGPPARRLEGRIMGDSQAQRLRERLRHQLREIHDYSARPCALIIDDDWPLGVLYGRWSAGSRLANLGWAPDGHGRWHPVGHVDLVFDEEA